MSLVLSHFQIEPLLLAKREGNSQAISSADLGLSQVTVTLSEGGATFAEEQLLPWEVAVEIAKRQGHCYVVGNNTYRTIQTFSPEFNCTYSLLATRRAPTVMISGTLMHRIKDVTPDEDTVRKVATIAPISGPILDTATGLGYTAIEAARRGAERVVTIEIDPVMQEVASQNPWSSKLFSDPRIERLYGDSFDRITELPDRSFARIIHDPPTFSLAGQLYSTAFYQQLMRILVGGGRLFHYVGDLHSPSVKRVASGVTERLKAVGFQRITARPEAFGIVATSPPR